MEKKFDVIAMGYTAIDYLGIIPRFPVENLKLELLNLEIEGGGPAATAAVTAGRLGLSVSFIGKVGDDPAGSSMLDRLKEEGIDISSVSVEKGGRSQFAFIMVDAVTAARTILWTRGSIGPLERGAVDRDMISSCRGLLVDSLEPVAALEAVKVAGECGIPVVIDAGTLREGVREILPYCDYIVASETFAGQISKGRGIEKALREIYSFGPSAAVVTLGERGCAALSAEGMIEVEGFRVDAVDTTGAGDVFHGAFIFAMLQGWDLEKICIFSNAVAAMKCRRPGGRAGIPTLSETMEFLGRERPDRFIA